MFKDVGGAVNGLIVYLVVCLIIATVGISLSVVYIIESTHSVDFKEALESGYVLYEEKCYKITEMPNNVTLIDGKLVEINEVEECTPVQ